MSLHPQVWPNYIYLPCLLLHPKPSDKIGTMTKAPSYLNGEDIERILFIFCFVGKQKEYHNSGKTREL